MQQDSHSHLLNLIRVSSFKKAVLILHMWLEAALLTKTELRLHDSPANVTASFPQVKQEKDGALYTPLPN